MKSLMRAVVTAIVVTSTVFVAEHASAQSRVDVVPSVAVANIYDNNLFAQTEGGAGNLLRLRPGIEANVLTPRLTLGSFATFDAQRSNHADLNTFDARRHGDFALQYRTTPRTTVGTVASYDRTETPGELNLITGILSDRLQAHRWEVTPTFTHMLAPRLAFSASYSWTEEDQDGTGAQRMQVTRATLSRAYSQLTNLTLGFLGRHFDDNFDDTNSSFAPMFGWEHTVAPGTLLSVAAGPRASTYRSVAPEVVASFVRATSHIGMAFDYWHGETIVLGIRGPVVVDSGTATISWPIRLHFDITSRSAVSGITTLADERLTTYRQGVIASWSPRPWYTIGADYGVDYQQGVIRHNLFFDENVLRHVFRVSLTVAPRFSRAIKPVDDPAARVKGVTRSSQSGGKGVSQ